VFAGGFDLESACAVMGSDDDFAILDLLDALVRKSLLVAGRTRFSMLETIRQFAEDQLVACGEASEIRAAHSRYFAGREADILALWDSPRQREAYDWFTIELANLHAAFRWAAHQGDLDAAATIASYAGFRCLWVENYEPIAWAEELIEPARAVDDPRLATLYLIASQCFTTGRDRGGRRLRRRRSAVDHQRRLRGAVWHGGRAWPCVCFHRSARAMHRVVPRPAAARSRLSCNHRGSPDRRTGVGRLRRGGQGRRERPDRRR